MTVGSYLDVAFYRDRARQCLELAKASRSVPSIKSRLEALAQKYQQRLDDLEKASPTPGPLAPDKRQDNYVRLTSSAVSTDDLHFTLAKGARERQDSVMRSSDELAIHFQSICAALDKGSDQQAA